MQAFRKFGATKGSKAMLILLIVCFAGWGIGDYLMPNIGAEAVTVNGEGVSPQAIEQTYKQRLDNISQLLGTKPTQEQIDQMQLPEQVVTEVVARTVLRQAAERLGFEPATKQLQDEIAMVSAFKNEQGQFDVARYRQILQQIGRSPSQFEEDLGQDIIVRNLALLSKVETPSPSLVATFAAAEASELVLDVATFKGDAAQAIPAPTESELNAFYKDNPTVYSRPESRDLVVLRLSREEITKSISVPESEVLAAYEANKAAYALPEQREVRHILFDSREDAVRVAAKIKSVEDFAREANAESKDPGNQGKGGVLGSIQEKDVVPAFAKVAFKIAENTLSEPVQSNFGWHLIWVDKIEPAKSLSFEETKDAIARDLQASQADEALVRLAGQVDEKIAAGEPLTKIAADVGIKPLQFNMVNAKDETMEPQELEAGFGLEKGEVSVPITMKDGGSAYVQAVDVAPARVLPLAEVKDRVANDWKNARLQSQLQENANKLLAAARDPKAQGDLANIAAKAGVSGVATSALTIKDGIDAPEWLQRDLLDVYPLPVGGVLPGVLSDKGEWHVVRVAERKAGAVDPAKLPELTKVYQQRLQGDLEALLMSYLTQQATVKLNQAHLKQLFGREVTWELTESR